MDQDTSPIDIDVAVVRPTTYFTQPGDVLTHPGLSPRFRRKILEHWEHDARLLSEAEAEGMGGGEESMLARVRNALRTLDQWEQEEVRALRPNRGPLRDRPIAVAIRDARTVIRAYPIAAGLFLLALGYFSGRRR